VDYLALTCGCYEDMYAEFEWDNFLDNSTQLLEAVNLSVDTEDTYPCKQNHVVCGYANYGVPRICTEKERW